MNVYGLMLARKKGEEKNIYINKWRLRAAVVEF